MYPVLSSRHCSGRQKEASRRSMQHVKMAKKKKEQMGTRRRTRLHIRAHGAISYIAGTCSICTQRMHSIRDCRTWSRKRISWRSIAFCQCSNHAGLLSAYPISEVRVLRQYASPLALSLIDAENGIMNKHSSGCLVVCGGRKKKGLSESSILTP